MRLTSKVNTRIRVDLNLCTQIFYPPPLPLVLTHPSLLFLFNQEEVYDLLLDNAIFYQDQRGLRCYRCRYVSNPIE